MMIGIVSTINLVRINENNLPRKVIFFLVFLTNFLSAYSEELRFEATSIELEDKDKIITAKQGVKILSGDEIIIDADNMIYNKEKKFLQANGNIIIRNKRENIEIKSDEITYDKNIERIVSSGNVEIKFNDNYTLTTKEIIYLKNSGEILINYISKITDNYKNEIEISQLNYTTNNKLLKEKSKIARFRKNLYNFDKAIIDFSKIKS